MKGSFLAALLAASLCACGGTEEEGVDPGAEAAAADAADLGAAQACGKDTWKSYAGKFFRAECAACHAGAFGSAAAVKASGARAAISSGRMPQGKALPAATKKRILAWFACGGP